MKITTSKYKFRQVVAADLKRLSSWLQEPLVSRWYADEDYIDSLEDHLEDNRIRMQLVVYQDMPIAYVQDYDIHAWTDHHLSYLPLKSRGIDTFIGSANWIGKGHGTHYLSLLSRQLFLDGIPALGIDPHPENMLARRAYRKIGFTEDGEIESEWGKVVTMSLMAPPVSHLTYRSAC